MRVKRGEYGAAPECKGDGCGKSLRKPADQRHRPVRFPHAKIQERPPPGIEPRSPRWELSSVTPTTPRSLHNRVLQFSTPFDGSGPNFVTTAFSTHFKVIGQDGVRQYIGLEASKNHLNSTGAELAESLACSPSTKTSRAQSSAGPPPDFRKWELWWVGDVYQDGGRLLRGQSPTKMAVAYHNGHRLHLPRWWNFYGLRSKIPTGPLALTIVRILLRHPSHRLTAWPRSQTRVSAGKKRGIFYRSDCSSPAKTRPLRFTEGHFRIRETCWWTLQLASGFSRGAPVSPATYIPPLHLLSPRPEVKTLLLGAGQNFSTQLGSEVSRASQSSNQNKLCSTISMAARDLLADQAQRPMITRTNAYSRLERYEHRLHQDCQEWEVTTVSGDRTHPFCDLPLMLAGRGKTTRPTICWPISARCLGIHVPDCSPVEDVSAAGPFRNTLLHYTTRRTGRNSASCVPELGGEHAMKLKRCNISKMRSDIILVIRILIPGTSRKVYQMTSGCLRFTEATALGGDAGRRIRYCIVTIHEALKYRTKSGGSCTGKLAAVFSIIQHRDVRLQLISAFPQLNGVTDQKNVGTPFANQQLISHSPAGRPANKEAFSACSNQSDPVPVGHVYFEGTTSVPQRCVLRVGRAVRVVGKRFRLMALEGALAAILDSRLPALSFRSPNRHIGSSGRKRRFAGFLWTLPFTPPLHSVAAPFPPLSFHGGSARSACGLRSALF
ncbi:hypothetical protein PR048_015487 [Dryococelus australis]|uniref:Uncharacterized protein n=1 Tax=Dryococelus australis TaxID=614101 RepID=A0ABQ9HH34_9NEOP|nr:hypothetical protein PR048_015487 [Dryococelus australis]